ncbi:MAG: patatin-like phospholipase family protein [Bacteroidetes bacterium]|nr:patatin-like phospholipase family protein [Bacteroidota bacterium]
MKTKFFQNCLGVFQGGGCRGAAYVGAYKQSIELGISFSELVGASAGSIIAVLIGAGATPNQLEKIIKELNFNSFLIEPQKKDFYQNLGLKKIILKILRNRKIHYFVKVLEYLGVHSSEKIELWIENKLQTILSIHNRPILFKDLIIPTTVTATNLENSDIQIWGTEQTPDFRISKAVRASCSIPLFFQPLENKYVDGGLLSNLPAFIFNTRPETHYNKVLAYCLIADFEKTKVTDIFKYSNLLANTIVDGAKNIQTSLQGNIYQINISTNQIKATDFDKMNEDVVAKLIKNGEDAVKHFIQDEYSLLHDHHSKINTCKTPTDTNNVLVESVENKLKKVIISGCNTKWVYELFPSLLSWTLNNAEIKFYLRKNNDDPEHGDYRQRLLKAMGVDVIYKEEIVANTFLFNPDSESIGGALVEPASKENFDCVKYTSPNDSIAIKALASAVDQESIFNGFKYKPQLSVVDENELFQSMKNVTQYATSNVKMSIKKVNIRDIFFLTQHVKGYKLRQINSIVTLYKSDDISLFVPTKLSYKNNKYTLVGIPVIEEINNKLFVIEGNTRLYYCFKNNIHEVYVLFLQNVVAPLPSNGSFKIDQMLLTDSDLRGTQRYTKFHYKHFRAIEKSIRDPKTCLK